MITIAAAVGLAFLVIAVVTVEAMRRSPVRVILLRLARLLLALPGAVLLLAAVLAWHGASVRVAALLTAAGGIMFAGAFVVDRLTKIERARASARGFDVTPAPRDAGAERL